MFNSAICPFHVLIQFILLLIIIIIHILTFSQHHSNISIFVYIWRGEASIDR